jgi:hypothetical protein
MGHGILPFYDLATQTRIVATFGAAGQRHVRRSDRAKGAVRRQHVQTKH